MVKFPFFSVIIPLYNKEAYISETIKSVLSQSYKDFEIIIINDGSTDNSLEKATASLANYENHTIFNQKNKGLSAARNKGISLAKGTVISLIDADDIWHEEFLNSIYNLYSEFPEASIYGTSYLEKYNSNNILETKKNLDSNLVNKKFIISDFFKANKFQPIICQSSIAFKKEIATTSLFNESINYAEDVDFYLKNLMKFKLAYYYNPLTTILCDVPGQITEVGINGKVLPDLDYYEKENPNNQSLKSYLDFKRYMYAIQYKIIGDKENYSKLVNNINFDNLTGKQVFLLKSPIIIIKLLKLIKRLFLKYNIRLTSFNK